MNRSSVFSNTDDSSSSLLQGSPDDVELRNPTSAAASPKPLPSDQHETPQMGSVAAGVARHTLGLILLLCVVFLWTASNFLGSTIFADKTYAKPFFLTYINTAVFILTLIPVLIRSAYRNWRKGTLQSSLQRFTAQRPFSKQPLIPEGTEPEAEAFLKDGDGTTQKGTSQENKSHLDTWSTARLSFQFCILWFLANYLAMACLQYTTVASTTILTSTASIWTLIIGAITRTEKFTWRKLIGVLASLIGVFLISQVDISTSPSPSPSSHPATSPAPNSQRDGLGESFPDKPPSERAFGDAMAALSAVIYGVYTITLKRTTNAAGREGKALNMPLFFGLVGLINTFLLLPLLPILSALNVEKFQLPPTRRIWTILLINSFSSLLSDICWAYAMVLTSPLVVTVGLSLTIPLSLVGELVVQGRSESVVYWIGAVIVVCSFVFVDREEVKEEKEEEKKEEEEGGEGGEYRNDASSSSGRDAGFGDSRYTGVQPSERSSLES